MTLLFTPALAATVVIAVIMLWNSFVEGGNL
jgi:ABC-type glycerol-3-phosphate transport system permease component